MKASGQRHTGGQQTSQARGNTAFFTTSDACSARENGPTRLTAKSGENFGFQIVMGTVFAQWRMKGPIKTDQQQCTSLVQCE